VLNASSCEARSATASFTGAAGATASSTAPYQATGCETLNWQPAMQLDFNGSAADVGVTDPSVAPPGKHVMSCFVQYAPYNLKEGNWDEKRDEFGAAVIDTIAEHAPNIRDLILHRQILTPLDLERDFGLSEGNIFQGELTLEQLFFLRPAPGWAQYRTPIKHLYMCGSATHPGGGIMGAPGRNAAMQMLKDK
jgi:phytoene dehydrogenase-like protein